MLLNLIGLGFVLCLDNFRTAIILGPLRFAWPHALKIAVVFGFFDGMAPLAGILLGQDFSQKIGGDIADSAGAIALGIYGLYLIVRAVQTATQEELEAECRWSIFGLPVPLSLDNVIAGTGLGIMGMPALVPAILFGAITTLMTLAGLQLGRVVSRIIPIRPRWDVVVGAALIIEAFIVAFWLLSALAASLAACALMIFNGEGIWSFPGPGCRTGPGDPAGHPSGLRLLRHDFRIHVAGATWM